MLRLTCLSFTKNATCRRNYAYDATSKPKKPETHYEVLNVRSDCSTRDIRNAFVQLSKQYHPDVQGNAATNEQTARFVKISEAYQTLVKPQTRKDYDYSLVWASTGGAARSPVMEQHAEQHRPWDVKPNYNPNPGHYYGIKGLKRVSNYKVALFLIVVCIFGAIFGFTSVRQSFKLDQQQQDDVSAEATSHHAAVRADAAKYGNQEQMRRMVERLGRDPFDRGVPK